MRCDTLGMPATGLPLSGGTLIGREREVGACQTLLRDSSIRLLTLSGPGGVGKSRLAAEVGRGFAAEFADGVFFVPLASIDAAGLVPSTIAAVIGIRERPGQPVADTLKHELSASSALVILDNFEHVDAAAPLLAEILAAGTNLKLLVTSRSVLRLSGEHHFPVLPLALPNPAHLPPAGDLAEVASIRLFVERVRAATGDFTLTAANAEVVADICRRLDGLPLAIELAASWSRMLPPAAIQQRLSERLLALGGGPRDAPARQQTIHDTIAWSHDLLTQEEQILFARLGVFAGGWTIEAAEAVSGKDRGDILDILGRLIDQSLVRRLPGPNGEPRFGMLETIRAYAREQLSLRDDVNAAQHLHGIHYLALAERARDGCHGPELGLWLARLDVELDNVRAVLERAYAANDADAALRLCSALWRFWGQRGRLSEGRAAFERALELTGDVDATIRGAALLHLGDLALDLNEYVAGRRYFGEGFTIWHELDDQDGIASALNGLGMIDRELGDYERARERFGEALTRWSSIEDHLGIAAAHHNLGLVASACGDYDQARSVLEVALDLRRQLRNARGTAYSIWALANVSRLIDDCATAAARHRESLAIFRDLGDLQGQAHALHGLAKVAQQTGDDAEALRLFGELLVLRQSLGERDWLVESFEGAGAVAISRGHIARGVGLFAAATALRGAQAPVATLAERQDQERALALARRALTSAEFAAAWSAGQALSPEQAAAEALALTAETAALKRPAAPFNLTKRELEVLGLLSQNLTDAEIADKLFLSPRTASNHVASILGKLGMENRRAAMAFATKHGLV